MGLDYSMQLIVSGVLNITQLVGVISSLWTLDHFGRRSILLWRSLGMFISHLGISILVGLFSKDWPSHRPEGWTSVAFLLFYMISFGASWGPVPVCIWKVYDLRFFYSLETRKFWRYIIRQI